MNNQRENSAIQADISRSAEMSDTAYVYQLFHLISKGDKEAFHRLFNLYAPFSAAIIKKIVGAGEHAEDILQEIFLKLWLKRASLPSVENPKAWIARVTCHACYNWLRHEKYSDKANAQIKYLSPDHNNEVEEAIGFTETAESLAKAVKRLPPQTRMIFKLNKEEGMKISEIADYLQLSPQTVKNTLGSALKKVKAYLRQQGLTS
jgi:RNA polymerase sigma-70 factor (ECF subfamily)